MPLTIRELLASDTISQAVDKINFNFDQLLLNGGGPAGPAGPPGPIGPIGGRGIRGSLWFEGIDDPNNTPPTLTPKDEDNYLRSDGEVWTYDGVNEVWMPAGVNLTGPQGPQGASGKFSEYEGTSTTYTVAGDTTLYADKMSFSENLTNRGIKALIIGGLPGDLPNTGYPSSGDEIIPQSLAQVISQPEVSMLVHQFNGGSGGIKFHGGAATDNFTSTLSELSGIRLSADDILTVSVPKQISSASPSNDGLRVIVPHRGQVYTAGKHVLFQTGTSTASTVGPNGFIVNAARLGGGDEPNIELNVINGSTAELRLGGTSASSGAKTGPALLNAGTISLTGNSSITGTAPAITINGSNSARIFAGGFSIAPVAGRLQLGASNRISLRTANGSSDGAIEIRTGDSSLNNIALFTGTASSGDVVISTQLGTGDVSILSSNDISTLSDNDTNIVAVNDFTAVAVTGSTAITAANNVTIGAVTGNLGLTTGAGSSGNINVLTGAGSSGEILISTAISGSSGNIRVIASDEIRCDAANDIYLRHGVADRLFIRPVGGNSAALVDIRPSGTGDRSTINIFHSASAGDTNLQLRSDATDGGKIAVSPGMRLSLDGGITSDPGVSDNPDVIINGRNHYTHSTQITTAIPNLGIISSGTFTPSAGRVIYWQRVGNVITCSGHFVRTAQPGGSDPVLSLPIIGTGGASTPHGSGTLILTGASSYHPVQIITGSLPDSIGFSSSEDLLLAIDIKFSFSYVIA